MAARVQDFRFRRGRPPKHPWDTWLDGTTRRVVQGVDFTSKIDAFVCLLRATARSRGGKVNAQVDGASVVFQYIPPRGRRKESE